MDTKSLLAVVEQLEENIEDLEENFEPLLERESDFASITKKLPLLDRAKLNVLVVYAIESLLFSYLKLQGVDAKEHAVFRELARVRQYFEKIKNAEPGAVTAQPSVTLNREAAERVIKHALARNDKYDLERAEREAREKFLANRKLKTLEASMKERARAQAKEEEDAEMSDALQLAAQLAAVAQPASSETSSSSEDDSEEEDDDDEDDSDEADEGVQVPMDEPQEVSTPASVPTDSARQDNQHPVGEQASPEQTPQSQRGKKRKAPPSEEQNPAKMSKKALGKEKAKAHRAEMAKRKAKRQAKKEVEKVEQKAKNMKEMKRQESKKAKKDAKKKAAANADDG
ncbi:Sas10/Utp3/C1D family-domain-containing protein [Exophiala viscosa]|uniref:Exosome complex protein n=1 Tax=Exophiala viscosa TaxID=2486360 RepID=A0AAN6IAW7_9EURO|nr:Sas10/Utp3/C1D family-domain-containing protein [Exophiala viscosa]